MRYLNSSELVSASTDSTLRLWDTKACTAGRVFSGHNNEKNFVGLSVDGDFMACGSETNEVGVIWSGRVCPLFMHSICHGSGIAQLMPIKMVLSRTDLSQDFGFWGCCMHTSAFPSALYICTAAYSFSCSVTYSFL